MLRTYRYDTVDPFRELTSLQQWMDQTLQQTLNSFAQTPEVVSNSAFVPKAGVFETGDQVAIKSKFLACQKRISRSLCTTMS